MPDAPIVAQPTPFQGLSPLSDTNSKGIAALFQPREPAAPAPTEPPKAAEPPPVKEPEAKVTEPTKEPEPAKEPDAPTKDDGISDLIKPKAAKTEPAKEPEAPEVDDEKINKDPKALRHAYKTLKGEHAALKTKLSGEVETLRTELKKAREEGVPKPELDGIKTELEAAREKVRLLDFTHSPDYDKNFVQPLAKAIENTFETLVGRKIVAEDGTETEVTQQNVAELLRMDDFDAADYAHKLFGHRSALALQLRKDVSVLENAKNAATEEWAAKGKQWSEEQGRVRNETLSFVRGVYDNTMKGLESLAPDVFGRPQDPALAPRWDKSDGLVKLAFLQEGVDKSMSQKDQMRVITEAQANVAGYARAFPVALARVKQLETKLAEAEAKLKGYTKSEPASGGKAGAGSKTGGEKKTSVDASSITEWMQGQAR